MIILRLQGLPWSATAKDIRQYFEGLSIPDGGVHIIGGEEGDVFIAFATDDDARKAMQRQKQPLNGSRIMLLLSSKAEMQEVIAESRAAVQMRKVDPFATVIAAAAAPSPPVQSQSRGLSQTREASVISTDNQTFDRYPSSNMPGREVSGYPLEASDSSSRSYPSTEYGSAYFNRQENQGVGKDGQRYGQENLGLPSNKLQGQGFEQDNQNFGRERQDLRGERQNFEQDSQNVGRYGRGFGRENQSFGLERQDVGRESKSFEQESQNVGPSFGRDNQSFGHDSQALRSDRQGFNQGKDSFGHDSQGFGFDSQGNGRDSQNYGRDSQSYERNSQGFGQSSQVFERDVQGYRQDGQGDRRDGQDVRRDGFERNRSFGQENQNVDKLDQMFHPDNKGFRPDVESFGQAKQEIRRDNQSYERDPQMSGRDGRDVGLAGQRFGKNTPNVLSDDFAQENSGFRRGEGQGPVQGNISSSGGMQVFGRDEQNFGRDDRRFERRSQIIGEDDSQFRRDVQEYRRDGEVAGQGDAFRNDYRGGSSSRVTTESGDNVHYGQAQSTHRFGRKDVPGTFDLEQSVHSREHEFEQNTLQFRTQPPFGSPLESKRESNEGKHHPVSAIGKPLDHWQFDQDGKLYKKSESQRTLLPSPAIESNTPEDEYMDGISTSYPPPGHSDSFDSPEVIDTDQHSMGNSQRVLPFDNKSDQQQPPAELWKPQDRDVDENTRLGVFNIPKFGDATWVSGGSTSIPPNLGSGRELRPDVLRRGEEFDRQGRSLKEEFPQRLTESQLNRVNQSGFNRNQQGTYQDQAMNRSIDFDNSRNKPNVSVQSAVPKPAGITPGGPPGGPSSIPPGGLPSGHPVGTPGGPPGGRPVGTPSGPDGPPQGLLGGPPSGPPGVLAGGPAGGPPGGPPGGRPGIPPGGSSGGLPACPSGGAPSGPSGGMAGGLPLVPTSGLSPSLSGSPINVHRKLEKKAPFFAVRLAGLPYSCSERDVRDFFKGVNIPSEGVQFHTDKRGKLTGTANVKVESKPDKDEALRQNKRYMGKRYIDVTHCTLFDWENGMKDSKLQSKRERSRSPARSTKSPIRGSNNHVEIKGISSSSREGDIKKFFEGIPITSIFVERGKDGSATAAYVEFSKPDNVKKACQMSGMYMGKRIVSVREISKEIVEAKKITDTKKRAERRSPGKRSPERRRGSSPRRDRSPGKRGKSPLNRSSSNSSPGRNGPGKRTSSPSRRDSRDRESSRSRNHGSSPGKKIGLDKMDTLSEKETLEHQSKEVSSRSSRAEQPKNQPSPNRSDRGNGESKKSELPKHGSASDADMRNNDRRDGEKGMQSGSRLSRREGRESRFGPEKNDLDQRVQDRRPPGLLEDVNKAPVVNMREQPINSRENLMGAPRRSRWENSQGLLDAENQERGKNMPGLMDNQGNRNISSFDGSKGGDMGRPKSLMDESQMRPFDRHGVPFPEGHGGPLLERRGPFPDRHGGSPLDERRGPLLDEPRGPFPDEQRDCFPDGHRGPFAGEHGDRFPDQHRGPFSDDRGWPFQEGCRGPSSERHYGAFPEGQGNSQGERRGPPRNWQEGPGPADERHRGPSFHDPRGPSRDRHDRDHQEHHMEVDQGPRDPFTERQSRNREKPDNSRGPMNDRKRPGEPWHNDPGENRPGRYAMENSGNRRGLLEDPGNRRGLLDDPGNRRGLLDDPGNRRGLLDDPGNRRGLLDNPEINISDVPEKRGRFTPNEEGPRGHSHPNRRDHSPEKSFEDEGPRPHFPNQQLHGRDEGRREGEMHFNKEERRGRQGSMESGPHGRLDIGRFENQERRDRENFGKRMETPEQLVPPENEYCCAHVRNMPYQARWPEIAQFFHGLQIVPGGIHIMLGPDGKPMGHCFIEFVNPHQARQSEERRLQTLRDRPLQINACSKTMMIRSLEQAGELPQMLPGQRQPFGLRGPPFGPRGPHGPGHRGNVPGPFMGPRGPNFGPHGPRPGAPFRPPFEGPQTRGERPPHQNDPSQSSHSQDRTTSRSQDRSDPHFQDGHDSRSRDRTDSGTQDRPSSGSQDELPGSRKSDVSKDRSDSKTENRGSSVSKKEESKPSDEQEEKKETHAPSPVIVPAPTPPKGCVVSATNLPLTITVDAIKDFFKGFDTVKGAVKLDTNAITGKATGQAKIVFVSPSEANRAIKERNNRPLNGRIVRLHVV